MNLSCFVVLIREIRDEDKRSTLTTLAIAIAMLGALFSLSAILFHWLWG